METAFTTIDACTREVEITLTNDDLQPHYERAYRDAQKDVEIKGFRKGKVPLPIIKQRFGRIIEQNSLDDIANAEFNRIVRNDNIKFVGQPNMRDVRKDPDSVTFVIRYEIIPDIELGEYRNLLIKRPVIGVTDAEVEHTLEDIRLRFGTMEDTESATDNMHIVRAKFTPLDDETLMPIIGAKSEESSFFLRNHEMDDNLRSLLLDSNVGDVLTFVEDAIDDQTLPSRFRVTVTGIQRVVMADLDNELAQKFSNGMLQTVEDLRADIVRFITRKNDDMVRGEMERQVVEQLSESHSFEVPETLVRRIMQSMLDNARKQYEDAPGIDRITIDDLSGELRPRALEIARWQVVSDKIAENEGVEIEDADLEPYMAALRMRQTKLNDTQLKNYLLQNEALVSEIFQRKTFDKIFEYAVITEISEDDYVASREATFHPDDTVRQYFNPQSENSLLIS